MTEYSQIYLHEESVKIKMSEQTYKISVIDRSVPTLNIEGVFYPISIKFSEDSYVSHIIDEKNFLVIILNKIS